MDGRRSESHGDVGHEEAAARELEQLREELQLYRRELAEARSEIERLAESAFQNRRGGRRAQKEAAVLGKALAHVLLRELRAGMASSRRFRARSSRIDNAEWQQVLLLHASRHFRADWYLRRYLSVTRLGMEPALHFLRYGVDEGLDPGPDFDLNTYLDEHPDVRDSGENPVIHAISREVLE